MEPAEPVEPSPRRHAGNARRGGRRLPRSEAHRKKERSAAFQPFPYFFFFFLINEKLAEAVYHDSKTDFHCVPFHRRGLLYYGNEIEIE